MTREVSVGDAGEFLNRIKQYLLKNGLKEAELRKRAAWRLTMKENIRGSKSSISKARSYADIGDFWDHHNLTEFRSKTRKVKVTTPKRIRRPSVRKDIL